MTEARLRVGDPIQAARNKSLDPRVLARGARRQGEGGLAGGSSLSASSITFGGSESVTVCPTGSAVISQLPTSVAGSKSFSYATRPLRLSMHSTDVRGSRPPGPPARAICRTKTNSGTWLG
jgi:hypothetical protein